jgi:DNA-binding transcriptional ArsR family regulator
MSSSAANAAASLFSALGDPTRLALVERLGSGPAASATALAEVLPVTRQAVAKHLDVLEAAGLVDRRRAGRAVVYELRTERLAAARDYLDHVSKTWDLALHRLRAHVEDEAPGSGEEEG